MTVIQVSNIEVVQKISEYASVLNGRGSMHTYQAFGAPGETVTVYGSNDQEHWTRIITLTVDDDGETPSKVEQHTFAYLRALGSATVTVGRGEA